MEKLWIIVHREYITRVRKRSFLLGTILAPLGMLLYFVVIIGLSKYQGTGEIRVAVQDQDAISGTLPDENGVRYVMRNDRTLEQLKADALEKLYDGVLVIPKLSDVRTIKHTVYYYSAEKLTLEQQERITKRLEGKIRQYKIKTLNLDEKSLEVLTTDVQIDPATLDGTAPKHTRFTTGFAVGMGMIMAFVMFLMVLLYGQMVMRSVMEEKTSRIVEVIMSSVRPFELMMGKIIGAGLVGVTQVLIWMVLNWVVMIFVNFYFAGQLADLQESLPQASGVGARAIDPEETLFMVDQMLNELRNQNWWLILGLFVLYFLGGYLIYASLFAAIGSIISDDMGEGQSLTLPITIPIILAVYIVSFAGIRDPNSGLMIFASIFPLFSPIVMPFRLAFDPPWWQIALSVVMLIAGTFFFVWMAGRIYRTGILMYGKKVSLKEVWRWMRY